MPAHDIYHNHVKNALIKDGWTITHDPLTIQWGRKKFYVDLGAKRLLAAEKAERKIAVEIKSFASKSDMADLEQALGQFTLYHAVLEEVDPERVLYVAVDEPIFTTVFQEPIGQLVLQKKGLCLIVFDSVTEEVLRWIP